MVDDTEQGAADRWVVEWRGDVVQPHEAEEAGLAEPPEQERGELLCDPLAPRARENSLPYAVSTPIRLRYGCRTALGNTFPPVHFLTYN